MIKLLVTICNDESIGDFFKVGTLDSNNVGGQKNEIRKKIYTIRPRGNYKKVRGNKTRFGTHEEMDNNGENGYMIGGLNPPLFLLRSIE